MVGVMLFRLPYKSQGRKQREGRTHAGHCKVFPQYHPIGISEGHQDLVLLQEFCKDDMGA